MLDNEGTVNWKEVGLTALVGIVSVIVGIVLLSALVKSGKYIESKFAKNEASETDSVPTTTSAPATSVAKAEVTTPVQTAAKTETTDTSAATS